MHSAKKISNKRNEDMRFHIKYIHKLKNEMRKNKLKNQMTKKKKKKKKIKK